MMHDWGAVDSVGQHDSSPDKPVQRVPSHPPRYA
jgi:hypothetical protein